MESLLSMAFTYLSSHDGGKIHKGLRQLEGLLAQICLSRSGSTPVAEKRRSVAIGEAQKNAPKDLFELKDDPAFMEFFKLQNGFQWNVAQQLIECLERLFSRGDSGQFDLLFVSTLDLLHGILLIHPPSRALFARGRKMELLLDLLDPSSCPAIQSAAILTLASALLSHPKNTRTFENLDGLLTVTSLFKSLSTSREVKMRTLSFLYFYLMPETPHNDYDTPPSEKRNPSKHKRQNSVFATEEDDEETRTTIEKQRLLGRYLSNVEGLVEDLRESTPFETAVT